MKLPSIPQIWEENKRFLLISGGGLLVFLVLYSFLVSNAGRAAEEDATTINVLRKEGRDLHKRLRDGYHEVARRVKAYEEIEAELQQQYCASASAAALKAMQGSSELHFNKVIDDIWTELNRRRSERSLDCELPPKITTRELDIDDRSDTDADRRRQFLHVELVRRALDILVSSGMKKIDKPRLLLAQADDPLPIRGNPTHRIVYQRLAVAAHGDFAAFLEVLRRCQESASSKDAPGAGHLQVALVDLGGRGAAAPDLIKGVLEFSTFAIEEDQAEASPAATKRKPSARRRQRSDDGERR